jgi:hypothetical protein
MLIVFSAFTLYVTTSYELKLTRTPVSRHVLQSCRYHYKTLAFLCLSLLHISRSSGLYLNREKDISSYQSLVNYRRVEKKATAAKYTKYLADETLNDELDEGMGNWRRDWERLNRDKDMGSEGPTKVPLLESPGLSEKMRGLSIE